MLIFTKLCVVMSKKILKILNNLFKQQFLIYLTYVLWKISAVEYSYQSVNSKIL
jgi:hypothetical protein